MANRAPENAVTATPPASALAEISGLRQQILGNANVLFPDKGFLEICVLSAEWPESGFYGARLVDISERCLLVGRQWAASVPEALGQLLQETCDEIRDSYVLQNYHALHSNMSCQ